MIKFAFCWGITTVVLTTGASCQICNEFVQHYPNDVFGGKNYGYSVAIEGDTVVVGAKFHAENGVLNGAAYVMDATTGAQLFKLIPNDATSLDGFGSSVVIHNGFALIGNDRSVPPAFGAAYLFDTTTGFQLFKFEADVPPENSGFAQTLDMNDDYIAIGAPFDDTAHFNGGAVYVFDRLTGNQLYQFLPGSSNTVWYGYSVALDGSTLLVGSPRQTTFSGAALEYDLLTGVNTHDYTSSTPETNDYFGYAVDINSDWIVAGAPQHSGNGSFSGSTYVFDRATGNEIYRLFSAEPAQEEFGAAVVLEGSQLVVGAPHDYYTAQASGAAYVYDLITGQEQSTLHTSDRQGWVEGSHVGFSLDIDQGKAVVGAPGTSQSILNAGAAHVFELSTGECWERVNFVGSFGTNGWPELRGTGPLASGESVTLKMTNGAPSVPTFLFVGFDELYAWFPAGGGTFYPAIDLMFPLVTDGAGELTLSTIYPIGAPSVPLHFQTWSLDPGAVNGIAGSRGLKGSVLD